MTNTVNLKKLSEMLGLSQTTVSRALNGFPEVNENTRKRVKDAAQALNYRPSRSATSLATGKTKVIGHIIPVSEHQMINPHFSDFLVGASETYAAAGYDLLLRMAGPGEEEAIYRDFANLKRVDGVIVHGPRIEEPRIKLLNAIGLKFVVHGRAGDNHQPYSWLDVNNLRAFEKATQLLLDEGHAQIGLVNGLESMNFALRRRMGYEQALRANDITINPDLITQADMTEPYGYEATKLLLKGRNSPTAIAYSSVLPAMGGLRALSELGLKPGKDVALITYDDQLSFLQSASLDGGDTFFTSLNSSIKAAGKRAAEMLINQIVDPEVEPIQELWEAELVLGQTTGTKRSNSSK